MVWDHLKGLSFVAWRTLGPSFSSSGLGAELRASHASAAYFCTEHGAHVTSCTLDLCIHHVQTACVCTDQVVILAASSCRPPKLQLYTSVQITNARNVPWYMKHSDSPSSHHQQGRSAKRLSVLMMRLVCHSAHGRTPCSQQHQTEVFQYSKYVHGHSSPPHVTMIT